MQLAAREPLEKTCTLVCSESRPNLQTAPARIARSGEGTVALPFASPRLAHLIAPAQYLQSDRYVEHELIGRGGMGCVIRAFDLALKRDVAIKVLSLEASHDEWEVERLGSEARIMARLEHPHIVPVYEFGADVRGARYLCMKLVEGDTLDHTLQWAGLSRLEAPY